MERARILVADDNVGILQIVAQTLNQEFEVIGTVENGKRAVDSAAMLDPDIIILDISMPVMNGIDAAMELKKAHTRAKIVFLSVQTQAEFMAAAYSAGAAAYVCKTRLVTDLLPVIHEVLRTGKATTTPASNPVGNNPSDLQPTSRVSREILIVDDERQLADSLVSILRRAGYTVNAVYSGEEALAFIALKHPSLVVSDVIMPGIDGISLAKTVRTSDPECRVVLFSGNAATQELLQAAQREGHTFDILAKPVPAPKMLSVIASIFEQTPSVCG